MILRIGLTVRSRWGFAIVSCSVLAALFSVHTRAGDPVIAAGDDVGQRAAWMEKQVQFTYSGFTTHYSCQGLAEKVGAALRQLGAQDVTVREGACTSPSGGPERFPNVDVKMNVLQPFFGDSTDQNAKIASAHWQRIDLQLDKDNLWQAGDCELLEQIKHTFLPLFATRNVDYRAACVAHQLMPGGAWLRADVLKTDEKSASAPR